MTSIQAIEVFLFICIARGAWGLGADLFRLLDWVLDARKALRERAGR